MACAVGLACSDNFRRNWSDSFWSLKFAEHPIFFFCSVLECGYMRVHARPRLANCVSSTRKYVRACYYFIRMSVQVKMLHTLPKLYIGFGRLSGAAAGGTGRTERYRYLGINILYSNVEQMSWIAKNEHEKSIAKCKGAEKWNRCKTVAIKYCWSIDRVHM